MIVVIREDEGQVIIMRYRMLGECAVGSRGWWLIICGTVKCENYAKCRAISNVIMVYLGQIKSNGQKATQVKVKVQQTHKNT